MWASREGHEAIARVLLAARCDKEAKTDDGLTALDVAKNGAIRALLGGS